jgi:hypothetical protein
MIGFRIVLGDALNGELASFDVSAEELPEAGDRLWELACRHVPGLGPMAAIEPNFWPAEKVMPLSRIIARAVPDNMFPVDAVQDPVMRRRCWPTLWFPPTISARPSGTSTLAERSGRSPWASAIGWRQSDRFRYGEEQTAAAFRHLYLEPAQALT